MNRISRRSALKVGGLAAVGVLGFPAILRAADPVRVGLLAPLSHALAFVGMTNRNCLELAVAEINEAGGILGRQVQIIVEDSQMSTRVTLEKARKLVAQDRVDLIIGTVLPAEREAALAAVQGTGTLVIHPNFDEGRCHAHLLTTGLGSNQLVEPFAQWLAANVGKTIQVIASDLGSNRDVFMPHLVQAFEGAGGQVTGVQYFPFGTRDYAPALQQVNAARPDIVWHVIGDDPITFMKQYDSFGMAPQLVTQIIHESIAAATEGAAVGVLGVSSYFMSLDNPANRRMIDRYSARFADFTPRRVQGVVPVLPQGESTYTGMHCYAAAAEKAGSLSLDRLKQGFAEILVEAPRGATRIDVAGGHPLSKTLIGRGQSDNSFEILAELGPVAPICGQG